MSGNNSSEGLEPAGLVLASGCISALIAGFVAVIALLVARSHIMSILLAAFALFWAILAFRVGYHWDDKGWTRKTHRGMIDSFITSLFALAVMGVLMNAGQPDKSRIDWHLLIVAILAQAVAELLGFFAGLWAHRRTLKG